MKKIQLFILVIGFPVLSYSQSLYNKIDSLRRQNNLPAIGCVVISADKIIDVQVCGYRRIDKQDKEDSVMLSDHFHLGSNTKAITGFIAAMLVEQGKMKWDTKFFDLFPQLKKEANPAYANITLQQLLSHRAGIQPFTQGEKEKAPHIKGTHSEQRMAFAKYVLKQAPVHPDKKKDYAYSGNEYVYSNAGYSIASLMLEKASGNSWEQLVTSFAQQLNIQAGFGWPNLVDSNQPWGHQQVNGHLIPLPGNVAYNLNLLEPAGDVNMNLPDYSRFVQLQLIGLSGKDSIIKATAYQFLHFGMNAYSIGWLNGVNKKGNKYSAHEGSAGTFHVFTVVSPIDDRAYIICTNAETDKTEDMIQALFKYLVATYK